MTQSRKRKRLVVRCLLQTAAIVGIVYGCCNPKAGFALIVVPWQYSRHYDHSFRSFSSCLAQQLSENEDLSSVSSPNSIEAAQKALRESDVLLAEEHLLQAVAQVNGAVMNHPPLLKGFEDLFRTKIRIGQNNKQHGDETSRIIAKASVAQDRMGLASLLTDQSKYQEAAEELKLAVESLAELTVLNLKPINWAAVDEQQQQQQWQSDLDRASSLLFRTRAMVCDWSDYETSSDNLRASTRNALLQYKVPPSVHPFEALAWPCLSLLDATKIAHAYANRAIDEAHAALWESSMEIIEADFEIKLDWYHLKDRFPNTDVSFVRAYTTKAATQPGDGNSDSTAQTKMLKVGYLSPDFTGKHPLAFLMQDVFRFHDTTKVQVVLYSLGGPPDDSPEVQKIIGSGNFVREWKTLEGRVETMAQTIFNDHLDVIIDLCGYTGTSLVAQVMACLRGLQGNYEDWLENSPELLMENHEEWFGKSPENNYQRPIHVSYMGFPGSSGAPYIDYMIADPVVVPSKFRPWYTENILYMPHCYFVNSHKHISPGENDSSEEESCTRVDYGLPPEPAFVFCCHSRPDKLDPSTFATWIRALQRTREEGRLLGNYGMAHAVLWLLRNDGANSQMEANLRKEASNIWKCDEKELDKAIVFCDPAPRHLHLRRLGLADVFLDTPAYNAHTVGCDCLSAGVPMISLLRPCHKDDDASSSSSSSSSISEVPTEKLASRVGASLLRSALSSSMLSDALVVSSMEEYEDCMVECARSNSGIINAKGDALNFRALRKELQDQRSIAPLWDTERWVRNLETGLEAMVELRSKGSIDKTDTGIHSMDYSDIYVMDYSDIDSQ